MAERLSGIDSYLFPLIPDCIWDMIVRKKMEQGRLDDLLEFMPAKDWTTSRDGGPRKSVREELVQ